MDPPRKVNNESMKTAKTKLYLGDKVHHSGNPKYMIIDCQTKAYAAFALIRAILEDVSLNHHCINMGLVFRGEPISQQDHLQCRSFPLRRSHSLSQESHILRGNTPTHYI